MPEKGKDGKFKAKETEPEPAPEEKKKAEPKPLPEKEPTEIPVIPLMTVFFDIGDERWPGGLKEPIKLVKYGSEDFDPSKLTKLPIKVAKHLYAKNQVAFTMDEVRDFIEDPRSYKKGFRKVRRNMPEWARPE